MKVCSLTTLTLAAIFVVGVVFILAGPGQLVAAGMAVMLPEVQHFVLVRFSRVLRFNHFADDDRRHDFSRDGPVFGVGRRFRCERIDGFVGVDVFAVGLVVSGQRKDLGDFHLRLGPALVLFPPGVNVIKLFTAVIYHHSMVILSFCVIKPYCLGDYHGTAVNYHDICETNVIKHNLT